MLQLFFDAFGVECALTLATFATNPFKAVVLEELGHLGDLVLVVVALHGELGYLLDAVFTSCHCQLLVLVLQVRDSTILFREFFFERTIHRFKLAQSGSHRRHQITIF